MESCIASILFYFYKYQVKTLILNDKLHLDDIVYILIGWIPSFRRLVSDYTFKFGNISVLYLTFQYLGIFFLYLSMIVSSKIW